MRYDADEVGFHRDCSLYAVVDNQRRNMRDEVKNLTERAITDAPLEQLINSLADKFSINVPTLDESNILPSRREIDIDMSRDTTRRFLGGPMTAKGTEITIPVPYTGDEVMFRVHASSHTMDYPLGRVDSGEIIFSSRGINLDSAKVRKEFDDWLARIKKHLDGMRVELGNFNTDIRAEIAAALEVRRQKIQSDDVLLKGLGFNAQNGHDESR